MASDKESEIKVITDDDESLKIIGELLANKTSRDLLKFLMNKSAYKKKISDELGVPFALVEHHLKKMESVGLVKITNIKLIKGGVLHKTYKITAQGIFILLDTSDAIEKKGTLKKIFKEGVKFTAIGIVAFLSWIVLKKPELDESVPIMQTKTTSLSLDPIIIPLLIIIGGLILEIIILKKKVRSPK